MRIDLGMLAAFLMISSTAHAGDMVAHVGQFSVIRDSDKRTGSAGMEYRFNDRFHGLRPTVGALANADGASYGYAGINWDLPLGFVPIVITPGVVAGAYRQGSSKDLGYGLEFRSSLEVTYRMKSGYRVGAAISHLSNAGLGDSNPGTETLQAVVSVPF